MASAGSAKQGQALHFSNSLYVPTQIPKLCHPPHWSAWVISGLQLCPASANPASPTTLCRSGGCFNMLLAFVGTFTLRTQLLMYSATQLIDDIFPKITPHH